MEQLSFIDAEYESRKRIPKREKFLTQMDAIIPWKDWCALIEPYYLNIPVPGNRESGEMGTAIPVKRKP